MRRIRPRALSSYGEFFWGISLRVGERGRDKEVAKKAENTAGEGHAEQFVNSAEVAKLIGKTSRTVQQLTSDGILPTTEVKNGQRKIRKYDKYKTVQAYIEYIREKEAEKIGSEKENEKLRIEIETKEAKLRMMNIQLGELEGAMHSAEDVEDMTNDLVLCIRSNLLAMPGQLAASLEGLSRDDISEKVEEAVCVVLEELSNYEYNPDEYRRRVRERNGWKEEEGMEE